MTLQRALHWLLALLVFSLLALGFTEARPRTDTTRREQGKWNRRCPVEWRRGQRAVIRLIRCVGNMVPVPGGAGKMLSVAQCESGFNPRATNGIYKGLYQHHASYWPIRAATYGFRGASIWDAQAQTVVTARMAAAGSWGPWACA